MINNIDQKVNKIGKYLYKNIGGSYKFKTGPQFVDVYSIVYYQIPQLSQVPGKKKSLSNIYEMDININITSYSNKIRVNVIELSPDEMTLGHFVIGEKKIDDTLVEVRELIFEKIKEIIEKHFDGYEFIY